MQSVYAKYRSLKVEIRELAALDLQRCGRGMLGRIRAKKAKNNTSLGSNGSSSARKSSANSVSNDTKITSRAKTAPTSTNSRNNSGLSLTSPPKGGRNSPPMSYSKSSPIPVDIYTKYRDLLNQKRDLKKKLKKFDEDFLAKWSRQPKKTDKEVCKRNKLFNV